MSKCDIHAQFECQNRILNVKYDLRLNVIFGLNPYFNSNVKKGLAKSKMIFGLNMNVKIGF